MFSHFNLIGSYAKTKLSCPVFVADELSLFKPRNSGLAVRNFLQFVNQSKITVNVDDVSGINSRISYWPT